MVVDASNHTTSILSSMITLFFKALLAQFHELCANLEISIKAWTGIPVSVWVISDGVLVPILNVPTQPVSCLASFDVSKCYDYL